MTNEKREQLQILLAEHTGVVIDTVINALAIAGSQAQWGSDLGSEIAMTMQRICDDARLPAIERAGKEDENLKYWCEVGGYDYEGEFPDPEPEPTTYTIESTYVHMTDAVVTRGKYHGGGLAVVAEAEVDGFNERETLSVNLEAYGLTPAEDTFYVKDYGPHEGLADALVKAGIATKLEPQARTFGPHDTTAWLMLLSEEIQ